MGTGGEKHVFCYSNSVSVGSVIDCFQIDAYSLGKKESQ